MKYLLNFLIVRFCLQCGVVITHTPGHGQPQRCPLRAGHCRHTAGRLLCVCQLLLGSLETVVSAVGEVVVLLHQHQDGLLAPHHLVEERNLNNKFIGIFGILQ